MLGIHLKWSDLDPVAEFKEIERRFKFKSRLKYGWFHLKLYQMFQDLSRRLIQNEFWRILADLNRGSNSLNSISDHNISLRFTSFLDK